MGRKKKPFIDKKHAQTFSLVPRSQKDPLHDDPDEPQYVLKQIQDVDADSALPTNTTDRITEQQKYGIYFDDDYDYLQHLKEPGATVLEPVSGDTLQLDGGKKALLPEELFGSEVDVQGHDQKVLPISGPQPGWDPDIVAALEAAECSNMLEEELEDDFVTMANGGETGLPVYVTEHMDDDGDGGDSDGAPWWAGRGDFTHPTLKPSAAHGDGSDLGGEDRSDVSSGDVGRHGVSGKKTAQFTEYSMTSSIVPRSEALTLLDDRFEHFMVDYEDSQLGAPEEEEEEEPVQGGDEGSGRGKGGAMDRSDFDKLLLESAVEDFQKNFADQLQLSEEGGESSDEDGTDFDSDQEAPQLILAAHDATTSQDTPRLSHSAGESGSEEGEGEEEEEEESDSDQENRVLVEVDERPREKWDCESILSTYSNLYNHPTRISEPVDTIKKQIKLSRKTGIPLGAVPGPERKTEQQNNNKVVSTTRPRQESKEEKRVRKHTLKEERRLRRAEKKATKLAFKSEQLKLERTLAGQLSTAPVV